MKTTGIIRQLDTLGRIVLPIELRRTIGIGPKDMIEIFVEGSSVILRKYEPDCLFCGGSRDLTPYKDKMICARCLKELRQL
ncbi:MAG: AbrB/MazE/SpoVT family DNA-binding domain-containing protein [Clostridia bacterium]